MERGAGVRLFFYMMRKYIILLFLAVGSLAAHSRDFIWFNGTQPVSYKLETKATLVVNTALDMWTADLQMVTGMKPKLEPSAATVRIVQLDKAPARIKRKLTNAGVALDSLQGKKDAFCLKAAEGEKPQLYVVGSDARGTAYAILELSRLAGVSPWVWWAESAPQRKEQLTLPAGYTTIQSPSVEYRGIFINDEDWTLQPWSWRTFEKGNPRGMIGARTYKEIFKLLLRLRANTIWPAMHESTIPFYHTPGTKEMADSCGIVIGTSHCEPLLCNSAGEWKVSERGRYNYITNRDAVQAFWTERLKLVAKSENLYTIGMRGVHDGSMEGVSTMEEKVAALQQVIDDQRVMLAKHVNKDVTKVPQVFVPYKEVLDIMENGLRVPDDVTLMWCDDNYGYLTRLSDEAQQRRKGGAGVYYHLSYWGRPHDYLWLTTTQPGLIYHQMRQAYDHNARRIWIANTHDPKTAAYQLELFLDMAWNIDGITPSTLTDHLEQWLCREFGDEAGKKLLHALLAYYRQCGIRKPEHMGWTQVELDRRLHPRGRSQVIDTEFSLTEWGGELDYYLKNYECIRHQVLEIEKLIPPEKRDAYFIHIKYPLLSAANMSVKMLEAQRARSYYQGQATESLWTREEPMRAACARSIHAYQEIREMTHYYNEELAGGKWKYSMRHDPRDLYVFNPPTLPVWLTEEEMRPYLEKDKEKRMEDIKSGKLYNVRIHADDCVAEIASNHFDRFKSIVSTKMLGHSMDAISLPKGDSLVYVYSLISPNEEDVTKEAVLYTAVIPTHPNDKGDIRISVRINDEEPQIVSFREIGRTDRWKQNVLRGQAVIKTKHKIKKSEIVRLVIKALDDNVVIDQWMLDYKPNRKFYLFPLDDNSTYGIASKFIYKYKSEASRKGSGLFKE